MGMFTDITGALNALLKGNTITPNEHPDDGQPPYLSIDDDGQVPLSQYRAEIGELAELSSYITEDREDGGVNIVNY